MTSPSYPKPHALAVDRSKRVPGRKGPKPCPVCYAPMVEVAKDRWECPRHGAPVKP
jgi:hypothetical protein